MCLGVYVDMVHGHTLHTCMVGCLSSGARESFHSHEGHTHIQSGKCQSFEPEHTGNS